MSSQLEKSLDEIIAERGPSKRGSGRSRQRSRGKSIHRGNRRGNLGRDHVSSVQITNLSYEISRDELGDLFAEIGPVRAVKMEYNRAGRPTGVAYVKYESYSDARNAVEAFDGKTAAGEPITVQIRPIPSSRTRGDTSSTSDRVRESGRPPAPAKKTADELDAELDAYMNGGIN